MYMPTHFEETRLEVLHELISARPLATLVTMSSGGIVANHIPLHLHKDTSRIGTLRGHVARSNPIWTDLAKDIETLVVFQGADSYISPSWYPTKQEHGRVVPTWNYVVVHAYGTLRVIHDPAWIRSLIETLTTRHEASLPQPWAVSDAPSEFVERRIGAIVGIEMVITRLFGKWKVSQNQPAQNQTGVIGGLKERGSADALAMSTLVAEQLSKTD